MFLEIENLAEIDSNFRTFYLNTDHIVTLSKEFTGGWPGKKYKYHYLTVNKLTYGATYRISPQRAKQLIAWMNGSG